MIEGHLDRSQTAEFDYKDTAPKNVMLFACLNFAKSDTGEEKYAVMCPEVTGASGLCYGL
jgi:hypothetical protein